MRIKFLYGLILHFAIISTNLFCNMEMQDMGQDFLPPEMEDLAKITEQLMSQLTPEERQQVDEKLNHFMSLSEEEQKKQLEEELEKLSSEMANIEAMNTDEPEEEIVPEVQEEKIPKKQTKPIIVEPTKIEQVKTSLNKIIKHSESLLKKAKTLPRVSTVKQVENDWLQVVDNLIELISYARITLPKEKLVNALASDEFDVLRNQLKSTAKEVEKLESKINVSDTAGLCIVYDDEQECDNEKLIKEAQQKLTETIPGLKIIIQDEQILWGLKRLFEKHAPEELKKVEQEKKNEKKYITEFKPGKEAPSSPSTSYKEPYFPFYGGAHTPGTYETKKDESSTLTPSKDSSKDGGKGGGAKAGDGKTKDSGKKDKEKGKDKDKDKKPKLPPLKSEPKQDVLFKNFEELNVNLEGISENITRNNILDFTQDVEANDQNKDDTVKFNKLVDTRELLPALMELDIAYSKANKNLKAINNSLKKMPEKQKNEYQKVIKELYEDPNLNLEDTLKAYNVVKKKLEKNQTTIKRSEDENNFKLFQEKLADIIKHHKKMKKLFEGKDDEEKKKDEADNKPKENGFKIALPSLPNQ